MTTNKETMTENLAKEKVKQYATLCYVSNTIGAAISGDAVDPEVLDKYLAEHKDENIIRIPGKDANKLNLLGILKELIVDHGEQLKIPLDHDPKNVVVVVEGKVFEASIKGGSNDQFQVTLASCSIIDGTLNKKAFTEVPVNVQIKGKDQEPEVVAIGTGMEIKHDFLLNRPHQADAVLSTYGLAFNQETGQYVESIETPLKDNLIVAGTGTGKTGILFAKTITSPNGGIISVPDSLVSEVERDARKFIGKTAELLVIRTNEDLQKIQAALGKVPPTTIVMSHAFLQEYVNNPLLVQMPISLAIDESHLIDKELMQQLKSSNNQITAVTGTPSTKLYKMFGEKPSFDMPVWYAQNILGVIRPVATSDIEVASEDPAALASTALLQHLGRSANMQKGMKGYTAPGAVLESSGVQGMICTAEDAIAEAVCNMLTTNTHNNNYLSPTTQARLQSSVHTARRTTMENNLKVDIILAIQAATGGKLVRNDLEARIRAGGKIDAEYNAVIKTYKEKMDDLNFMDTVYNSIIASSPRKLTNYADFVLEYLTSLDNDHAKNATLVKMEDAFKEVAILLRKDAAPEETQRALDLYNKGLIMQIITSGPLKTGFSNQNTLNVTYIQANARQPGDTADVVQSLGRGIRAPDGFSFVNMVVKGSIPIEQRCMTAAAVFSDKATTIYMQHLQNEEQTVNNKFTAQTASPPRRNIGNYLYSGARKQIQRMTDIAKSNEKIDQNPGSEQKKNVKPK